MWLIISKARKEERIILSRAVRLGTGIRRGRTHSQTKSSMVGHWVKQTEIFQLLHLQNGGNKPFHGNV